MWFFYYTTLVHPKKLSFSTVASDYFTLPTSVLTIVSSCIEQAIFPWQCPFLVDQFRGALRNASKTDVISFKMFEVRKKRDQESPKVLFS